MFGVSAVDGRMRFFDPPRLEGSVVFLLRDFVLVGRDARVWLVSDAHPSPSADPEVEGRA